MTQDHKHESGFSFTNFFQETSQQPNWNQRPEPPLTARRLERPLDRKREDENVPANGDKPLWQRLPAWVPIVCWIATSSFVILQNKYILSGLKYQHPVVRGTCTRARCRFADARDALQALTTIHLLFQTIATRVLRQYTGMVDKAKELEATGSFALASRRKKSALILIPPQAR